MSYAILDPVKTPAVGGGRCALAVMAKAPRAGKVKTRLSPPLTLAQTAALNVCFLMDTTENLEQVCRETASRGAVLGKAGCAGLISYTPVGEEALFEGILPESFALIAQRGDGFGERLHAAAEDILACGFGAVCLIDSDSPTVPAAAFAQAVKELGRAGDRIVLGPSHDGGYYLIGMKQAHREPFEGIAWSTGTVCAETVERVRGAGIELVMLPVWYDVDDEATLEILRGELLGSVAPAFTHAPGYAAPHTREFLSELDGPDDLIHQPARERGA